MPDFSDIEKEGLNISRNYIRTIYQDSLPRSIKRADFSTNYIHSDGLPFRWPTTLEEIYLERNLIQDTDGVSWPRDLKKLVLSRNPLAIKPEMLPDGLEVLILDHTELTELVDLPMNLRHLNVAKSCLKKLQKQLPLYLEVLLASDNFLCFRGLPTSWGMSLKTLVLDHNRIHQFPTGLPDSLEILSLNYNKLEEIPSELPKNLKHLSVIGNRLRRVYVGRRKTPMQTAFLNDNQLLESIEEIQEKSGIQWTQIIWEDENWNEEKHRWAAKQIQKAWRVSIIPKALRSWLKTARIKDELLEVSMHPSRIGQFDELSNAWYKMV